MSSFFRSLKKYNLFIFSLCLSLIFLASCSNKKVERNIDQLNQQLKEKVQFGEELKLMVEDRIANTFDIDQDLYEDIIAYYSGSGSHVDTVLIVEAKNGKALTQIDQKVGEYLQKQEKAFADYVPTEVPKLNSAVRKHDKCYYVLVVSDDNTQAATIVDEWLK